MVLRESVRVRREWTSDEDEKFTERRRRRREA